MELEDILLKVQKPGRYIGGEQGAVIKDKSKIDVRFAFCFADSYEGGLPQASVKSLLVILVIIISSPFLFVLPDRQRR